MALKVWMKQLTRMKKSASYPSSINCYGNGKTWILVAVQFYKPHAAVLRTRHINHFNFTKFQPINFLFHAIQNCSNQEYSWIDYPTVILEERLEKHYKTLENQKFYPDVGNNAEKLKTFLFFCFNAIPLSLFSYADHCLPVCNIAVQHTQCMGKALRNSPYIIIYSIKWQLSEGLNDKSLSVESLIAIQFPSRSEQKKKER